MKFSVAACLIAAGSAVAKPLNVAVAPVSLVGGVVGDVTGTVDGVIGTVDNTLSGAVGLVSTELTTITKVTNLDAITGEVVPLVITTLKNVEVTVTTVLNAVGPIVGTVVTTVDQLVHLTTILSNVELLVGDIKTAVVGLVDVVEADVLALLLPEIQSLLNTVLQVAGPVVQFATAAAHNVTGAPDVSAQVIEIVAHVDVLTTSLVAPANGVVSGL